MNDSVVLDRHETATANDTQTGMGNTIITNTDDNNPNEANSNPDEANNNPNEANNNPDEGNSNPDENTKDKKDKTIEHKTDDDSLMQLTYLDIQDNPVNSLEGFRAINKDLQYLDVRYQ